MHAAHECRQSKARCYNNGNVFYCSFFFLSYLLQPILNDSSEHGHSSETPTLPDCCHRGQQQIHLCHIEHPWYSCRCTRVMYRKINSPENVTFTVLHFHCNSERRQINKKARRQVWPPFAAVTSDRNPATFFPDVKPQGRRCSNIQIKQNANVDTGHQERFSLPTCSEPPNSAGI